jgi:N-acetylmuramoyl-L-alanine amidase
MLVVPAILACDTRAVRIIRPGDAGDDVRDVQRRLIALGRSLDPDELEGRFGPSTLEAVRSFQTERRLPEDGLVGPDTWAQLVEAGYGLGDRVLYLRYPFLRGDDVRALQRRLNALGFDTGREDGILGRETDSAIREFQRNIGDAIDGIVGPDTIGALARLRPDDAAPSRAVVREAEALRSMHGEFPGAVVAIDAGHGSDDPGISSPHGDESIVTLDLAVALAQELEARGSVPLLLRAADSDPTPSERAQLANDAGAFALVSLHLADDALGTSCAFFGTASTYSPAGERLAQMIQQNLCGLGLADRGTHRLAISLLRETKMPAVEVEVCGLRAEGNRLHDNGFRRDVIRAIAGGIERFLSVPAEPAGVPGT